MRISWPRCRLVVSHVQWMDSARGESSHSPSFLPARRSINQWGPVRASRSTFLGRWRRSVSATDSLSQALDTALVAPATRGPRLQPPMAHAVCMTVEAVRYARGDLEATEPDRAHAARIFDESRSAGPDLNLAACGWRLRCGPNVRLAKKPLTLRTGGFIVVYYTTFYLSVSCLSVFSLSVILSVCI
jgi:hypothetical protein